MITFSLLPHSIRTCPLKGSMHLIGTDENESKVFWILHLNRIFVLAEK
jgi:hypothetical protein